MADWYVKSGQATELAFTTAYSVGQKVVVRRADVGTYADWNRGWVWECTTAGTSGSADPTWPIAAVTQDTTTFTSGSAIFTARKPGYSSGSTVNWAFATPYTDYCLRPIYNAVNGDRIFISNNHSQTISGSFLFDSQGADSNHIYFLCVDDSAAPPTTLATGAMIASSGTLTLDHYGYFYGIRFRSAASMLYVTGSYLMLDNCVLELAGSGSTEYIEVGKASGQASYLWINTKLKFSHVDQRLRVDNNSPTTLKWIGGGLESGSSAITGLLQINNNSNCGMNFLFDGVDFSLAATGFIVGNSALIGPMTLRNCKMPSGWTGALYSNTPAAFVWPTTRQMFATDSANTNHRMRTESPFGRTETETTLVRTGGASDGTTPIAWKVTTASASRFPLYRAETPEIVRWNETTGSSITATVEILHDNATALNDDEVWIEVQYMGDSASPLTSVATDRRAMMSSAAAQDSSGVTWTTTGMSNPNKQKVSVSFTPQKKGYLLAKVCVRRNSYTVYVDPLLTVT